MSGAGTARDPRDIRFNDLRLDWVESSAEKARDSADLLNPFTDIPQTLSFFEKLRDSFGRRTWTLHPYSRRSFR